MNNAEELLRAQLVLRQDLRTAEIQSQTAWNELSDARIMVDRLEDDHRFYAELVKELQRKLSKIEDDIEEFLAE